MPTSAFGADIPRIFGIARVPTTIIYASKVRQRRRGKGGGFGKGNNKKYYGNMAAVVGEGERPFFQYVKNFQLGNPSTPGELTLRRIFLNDKIWVDYTAQATPDLIADTARREEYFEFYSGSLTQSQDPTLVAQLGALNVSSYRGLSYIVFSNLELTDFGGNYPTVKVEVSSDIPPTFTDIISDIMFRAGKKQARPLALFSDYTITSEPDPIVLDGYILSQDVSDYRSEVANLMQIFRRMAIQTSDAWTIGSARSNSQLHLNLRNIQPTWAFIPSSGSNNVLSIRPGESTSMYKIPQPYSHEYKDADKFPTEMQLSYIQPRLDFEREVVVASRASQGLGDTLALSLNAVLQDRSVASRIATYLIREGWNRVNHINFKTQDSIKLGNRYIISAKNPQQVLVTKKEIGADGRTSVLGVIAGAPNTEDVGQNTITINTYGNSNDTGPENIIWTEGPSLDGAVSRSALVILAPRVGSLDSGTFGTVLASTDGGGSYNDINTALTPNSLKVPLTGISTYAGPTNVIDTASILTIVVPQGIQLYSISESQLWDRTRNLIYVEGRGMIAFQTATLTTANTYQLKNILWNVLGTEDDQLFNTALPAFGWFMTADPYSVPLSYPAGTTTRLGVFDAAGTIYSFYERTFRGLNQSPRPVNTRAKLSDIGELIVDWEPGVSQTSGTPALLFEDNITTATSHSIYVYSYNKSTKVFTSVNPVVVAPGNISTFTFTPVQVAAFSTANLASLAVVIVPSNGLGIPQPYPQTEAAHVTARTAW
jgi:Putative phage tail protein